MLAIQNYSYNIFTNSLDPDETPSNTAFSSGSKLFDTHTTLSSTLSDIEAFWKLKQTRN